MADFLSGCLFKPAQSPSLMHLDAESQGFSKRALSRSAWPGLRLHPLSQPGSELCFCGEYPAFAVGAVLLPASTCRKGSPGCWILTLKCEFQTPCEFADLVLFPSLAPSCFCYKPPDLCIAFRGRSLHWHSYELGWATLPSSIPWPLAPSQHSHVHGLHVRMSPKPF